MSSARRAADRGDGSSKAKGDVPKEDVEYWTTVANKLAVDDKEATATEKRLLSDSLGAVRKSAASLDDTRWLFEDMPCLPESIEASVGL